MAPAFDPRKIIILNYRDRKLATFRSQCHHPEDLMSVARKHFRSLRGTSVDDMVLVATIPGQAASDPVEIAPELWPMLSPLVDSVTITLESEKNKSVSTFCKSWDSSLSLRKDLPWATSPKLPNPLFPPLPQQSTTLPVSPLQSLFKFPFQAINIKFLPNSNSASLSFRIEEVGLLEKKVFYLCEKIQTRGSGLVVSELLWGVTGLRLDKERTLSSYGISSESTITVVTWTDNLMGRTC
ncbi:hypothetical protein EI94DRAFT_1805315 [Lactarius quietus]|nr:hypothetical protein EI94DRAFT_1805315 [Lactarius quietus]